MTPSLASLAHLLRHPEMWPPNFWWDAKDPNQNAIGLAYRYWRGPYPWSDDAAEKVLMTHLADCSSGYKLRLMQNIGPAMVADAIDAYLAENPGADIAPNPNNPLSMPTAETPRAREAAPVAQQEPAGLPMPAIGQLQTT